MRNFVLRVIIYAAGIALVAEIVPGIRVSSETVSTLLIMADRYHDFLSSPQIDSIVIYLFIGFIKIKRVCGWLNRVHLYALR